MCLTTTHISEDQREQDVDEENIHQTIKAFIIKKNFGWINLIFIKKSWLGDMIIFLWNLVSNYGGLRM